jgi:sortase A
MWGRGPETATVPVQTPSVPPSPLSPAISPAAATSQTSNPDQLDHPVNGVAFHMNVPAIGYSATVREGVDLPTLEYGPGHYPATSWPGQVGIVGVAAHNVYWLRFSQLKAGDLVRIQTRRGLFAYRITGSEITNPDDRSILVSSPEHRLVLTTCWPLWAGAFATRRLIFFAVQLGPGGRPA